MELPKIGELVPLDTIKEICKFYELESLWKKIENDVPINPFKSDGCSCWFDSWDGVDMYPACFIHDLKYWSGYLGEDIERLIADAELMIDLARLGLPKMAVLMFNGVRIGGTENLEKNFSWGFGRRRDEK